MSTTVSGFAAQETADLNAISTALSGIATGITALDALITNFQNSSETLSASDQSALDAIQAASAALVTQAQAISVTAPTTTTPPASTPSGS